MFKEFGFSADGHEEKAPPTRISGGPGNFWDTLEGAQSSYAAAMYLSKGLSGGNADPGAIVASWPGSKNDRIKRLSWRKCAENISERSKEIYFL